MAFVRVFVPVIVNHLFLCCGIVAGSDDVVVLAYALVEDAELDQAVAHHVRVWCQSSPHACHRVVNDLLPIVLVEVDDLERQTVFVGHGARHLQVLLDGASEVGLVAVGTYLNIPQVGAHALFYQ